MLRCPRLCRGTAKERSVMSYEPRIIRLCRAIMLLDVPQKQTDYYEIIKELLEFSRMTVTKMATKMGSDYENELTSVCKKIISLDSENTRSEHSKTENYLLAFARRKLNEYETNNPEIYDNGNNKD